MHAHNAPCMEHVQNLEKMHATRSFTFEEEEEWMVVAGRQDSKYQKFLSKRYVCVHHQTRGDITSPEMTS